MKFLKNKILLITGGTGSFGKEILKEFINTNIKEIRVFSRDEKKQEEVRDEIKNIKIKFYIGDTRDFKSIDNACKNVDYIFHAAALKQVPTCEFYPLEAIKTNILGTENTLEAAIKNKVKKVILLSTDKAVYPINAMGLTKALAEKVMLAKSRNVKNTIFCATRYGNVMLSRGSVIPKFINQIQNKEDITITNPVMTRFMMSLNQSVNLVMFAMKNGSQGDIFVQKSPAATMLTLANTLKKIFKSKSKIKLIGTRHGEKEHETLVSKEEMAKVIEYKKFYRIPNDQRDLNYEIFFSKGNNKIEKVNEYNSSNTHRLNEAELEKILLKLDYIKKCIKY
jgi:UDP-N-acetylglucosamine 4,6-dehydratase